MRSSLEIFLKHFSHGALHEIVDMHLNEGVARGVDGTSSDAFLKVRDQEINLISKRVISGTYRFSPYRQKLILKDASSPPRQVSIPTIRDRVTLRALNNFLSEVFFDCRPQHSHPIISSVIKDTASMSEKHCFIKLDIKSFYDSIDHTLLIRTLRTRIRNTIPLSLISKAIKTPTGATVASRDQNEIGVPQGLSISNILSSIYLKTVDKRYESMSELSYNRYVDDILCITAANKAEEIAKDIIMRLKRTKKLTCHPLDSGKSAIVKPGLSVLYLGYSINSAKISVRPTSEKKLMSSIMEILFSSSEEAKERAVWRINLRISGCKFFGSNIGWVFYFSQINDLSLLAKMDVQIKSAFIKRFGEEAAKELKRIVKTYFQVKYNLNSTNYVPDFDFYTRDQKISHLELLAPGRYKDLHNKSDEQISRIFGSSIWREVKRMERDTLGNFS